MKLFKESFEGRSFFLTKGDLSSEGYELISDVIADGSTIYPVISQDIYDAINSLPGDFLSNGFSILLVQ